MVQKFVDTKSLFILLLSIGANFVGETLSCDMQNVMRSMLMKNLLVFMLIVFTVSMDEKDVSPNTRLLSSLKLFLAYTLLTKSDIRFTIPAIVLTAGEYLINEYQEYYKKNDDDKLANRLEIPKLTMQYTSFALIFIGVLVSTYKTANSRRVEFGDFIIGKQKCTSF